MSRVSDDGQEISNAACAQRMRDIQRANSCFVDSRGLKYFTQ